LNGGETAERLSSVGGSKAGDFSFIRVENVSAVAPPRGGEIYGSRAFSYLLFLFLYYLTRIQPIPVNRF